MLRFLLSKMWVGILISIMVLTACDSGSSTSQTNQPTPIPTQTTIPFFNYVQPTLPPALQTISAATATAASGGTPSPSAVELGRAVYVALQCNTCHGDKGEGTDKGKALTSFAMSVDDFISFMRSGGTVGSTHQYDTDKLSDDNAKNLYEYLKSLTGQ